MSILEFVVIGINDDNFQLGVRKKFKVGLFFISLKSSFENFLFHP